MSEYQYYEFCKISAPLTSAAKKEMSALSSRAKISTHGASYVYNYGDFRGNEKDLLLKHFDVFFYISNWGSIRLMFKYSDKEVNADDLKKYCVQDLIMCQSTQHYTLLEIDFNNDGGFGWIEGEGILAELLPLYDEIKSGNYQFLRLVADIHNETDEEVNSISEKDRANLALSPAQEAFFEYAGIASDLIDE